MRPVSTDGPRLELLPEVSESSLGVEAAAGAQAGT